MKRKFYKDGIAGLALALGLLSSFPAYAVVCGLTGGSIFPNPSGTCAEVSAIVNDGVNLGSQGNPTPFNYGFSPTSGTVSVIIAGTSLDASASVTAEIGTLHLFATSSDLGSNSSSFASARASAAFADTGTVTLPGAAFGTAVHASVTVAIDGSHTLVAGFGPDIPHLNVGNFINVDGPNGTYFFNTTVGAVIPLSLGLEIFADSSILSKINTADYSNTAQLFFDFTESGAFFSADSGHNYSSAAIGASTTPVPAALPLFASGLGALGLLGWRRKRKNAAALAA
jgi:hypothetical protein